MLMFLTTFSYILQELGYADRLINVSFVQIKKNSSKTKLKNKIYPSIVQLPPNSALSGLCDAMVEAWNLQSNRQAAILFIVEDVTYNICDQVNKFYKFCKFNQLE